MGLRSFLGYAKQMDDPATTHREWCVRLPRHIPNHLRHPRRSRLTTPNHQCHCRPLVFDRKTRVGTPVAVRCEWMMRWTKTRVPTILEDKVDRIAGGWDQGILVEWYMQTASQRSLQGQRTTQTGAGSVMGVETARGSETVPWKRESVEEGEGNVSQERRML